MHARVSRGKGGSIVATAAYNGRCRLVDEQTGEVFDYRHLGAAEFSGIYAPKDAPAWARDLQQLVNQIERTEKRADAQLGFNLDIALPCEMTLEQNRRLGQDFAREEWQRKGYAVVVDIHRPDPEGDPRNWHMHVWGTLRKIGPDGFARTKGEQQENYRNRHEYVEELRQKWERLANRHLERNGYDARIDMRSLKDQGIDREPEQHRGPTVTAIERENRASTVVVEINQWRKDIAEERALLAEDRQLAAAEKQIEAQIIDLQAKRAEREAREAAKGLVDDIWPMDDQKSRPQDAPEAVQGQYAASAPSAPAETHTRATEPENAAEAVREWQAHDLKTTEPGIREWQAHSFDSDEQLGHDEQSFGSRIWGAVAERFASFINYFRAPEPTPTKEQPEPKQDNADLARYFDNDAERNRLLDQIARDDAERSFAERFGTPPGHDLGPSDDEITKARKIESATAEPEITDAKAAKLAALARQRAETEQSIRDREKDPDRGYELDM
jgi:hypothetical protein